MICLWFMTRFAGNKMLKAVSSTFRYRYCCVSVIMRPAGYFISAHLAHRAIWVWDSCAKASDVYYLTNVSKMIRWCYSRYQLQVLLCLIKSGLTETSFISSASYLHLWCRSFVWEGYVVTGLNFGPLWRGPPTGGYGVRLIQLWPQPAAAIGELTPDISRSYHFALPWTHQLVAVLRKSFVNVHWHCMFSNLKKVSKMSTLPPEKTSADAHAHKWVV